MRPPSVDDLKAMVLKLGKLVEEAGGDSALAGLTIVAFGFRALLDFYAAPNPDNPQGMCDDKAAFRKYFADLIDGGPGEASPAKKGGKR